MESFETIAEVNDPAVVRVLIAALQAHGFHPRHGGEFGVSGFPGVYGPRGFSVELPESEARDGRLLATVLLDEMTGR